jgi:hypothetical protein
MYRDQLIDVLVDLGRQGFDIHGSITANNFGIDYYIFVSPAIESEFFVRFLTTGVEGIPRHQGDHVFGVPYEEVADLPSLKERVENEIRAKVMDWR